MAPLVLQVGLFHVEELVLFIISSPLNPIILEYPWLSIHNLFGNGGSSHIGPIIVLNSTPENSRDIFIEYHNLSEVFSKENATKLCLP